jgi:3-methyladenine DNA glycosylase/8-oxoguanine DNA glycosylase
MPGGKSPGPSIKNPSVYEALRRKGMSKSKAAAISNAQARKVSEIPDRMHGLPPIELSSAHPGFEAVARSVAGRQGVSMERARAIVAAGTRGASAKAKKRNPRLKRVKAAEPIASRRERLYTALKARRG